MITEGTREKLFKRHRGACIVCGSSAQIVIDHVRARAVGGPDDDWNLQLLCKSCNSSKGDDDMQEWLASGRWRGAKERNVRRRATPPPETVAARIILDFGSLHKTGAALGLTFTTVQRWRGAGFIPVRYWRAISQLLPAWTIERIALGSVDDMDRLYASGHRRLTGKKKAKARE